jgi:hypothetical protein
MTGKADLPPSRVRATASLAEVFGGGAKVRLYVAIVMAVLTASAGRANRTASVGAGLQTGPGGGGVYPPQPPPRN